MASLTVRNVPEDAKHRFRQIAAAHGRSMEEHLRQLVIEAHYEDAVTTMGVNDVHQSFRHAPPADDPLVSTGSPVIDELLRLGRGLDFEPPPREFQTNDPVFDPEDFR